MGYLKLAITPEHISDFEPRMVCEILDARWDMVHLRHPAASYRDMRNLIEAIPQRYHSRLRLHDHFELLNSFNLGGIHLNRRCPDAPSNYHGPYSRSCHSLDEIKACGNCDYVTLSPIFDSISKKGYLSAFDENFLHEIDKTTLSGVNIKVIALGGINPGNINKVKKMDFDGIAVLGALTGADSINDFRKRLEAFTIVLDNN